MRCKTRSAGATELCSRGGAQRACARAHVLTRNRSTPRVPVGGAVRGRTRLLRLRSARGRVGAARCSRRGARLSADATRARDSDHAPPFGTSRAGGGAARDECDGQRHRELPVQSELGRMARGHRRPLLRARSGSTGAGEEGAVGLAYSARRSATSVMSSCCTGVHARALAITALTMARGPRSAVARTISQTRSTPNCTFEASRASVSPSV